MKVSLWDIIQQVEESKPQRTGSCRFQIILTSTTDEISTVKFVQLLASQDCRLLWTEKEDVHNVIESPLRAWVLTRQQREMKNV